MSFSMPETAYVLNLTVAIQSVLMIKSASWIKAKSHSQKHFEKAERKTDRYSKDEKDCSLETYAFRDSYHEKILISVLLYGRLEELAMHLYILASENRNTIGRKAELYPT
jgi:hypothetical protein